MYTRTEYGYDKIWSAVFWFLQVHSCPLNSKVVRIKFPNEVTLVEIYCSGSMLELQNCFIAFLLHSNPTRFSLRRVSGCRSGSLGKVTESNDNSEGEVSNQFLNLFSRHWIDTKPEICFKIALKIIHFETIRFPVLDYDDITRDKQWLGTTIKSLHLHILEFVVEQSPEG